MLFSIKFDVTVFDVPVFDVTLLYQKTGLFSAQKASKGPIFSRFADFIIL